MASKGRTLTIYLAADTKKAGQQVSTFGDKLKNLGKVGAVAAAAGLAILAKKMLDVAAESVNLASDLEEVNSKLEAIYGRGSAANLDKWAAGAADAFGLSEVAAKNAAATFAVFGKDAGLTGTELENFSTSLVELGADMASFNNTSLEQALGAIKSGLAGSSEPLLNFGVNTQVAALPQQALADGLLDSGEKIDASNKTLRVYNQLMAKTTDQQGDFARTSDGLANSQRILAARMEDLKTQIGVALLPVVTTFTAVVSDTLLPALTELWEEIDQDVIAAFEAFSDWMDTTGREAIEGFVNFIKGDFMPAMELAVAYLKSDTITSLTELADAFTRLTRAIGGESNDDGTVHWFTYLTRAVIWLDETMNPLYKIIKTITAVMNGWSDIIEDLRERINSFMPTINAFINALKTAWEWAQRVNPFGGGGSAPTGRAAATRVGTFNTRSRSSAPTGAYGNTGGMGGVNITVNTGVGDPIEIARTIEDVLRTSRVRLGTVV